MSKKTITVTYLDAVTPTTETALTEKEVDGLINDQPINTILHLGVFSQTQLWYAVNFALNAGHFAGASRRALELIRDELDVTDLEPAEDE